METVKKEKVLITGASGFIGTNLLNYLKGKGYDVLNVDLMPPAREEWKLYWQKADITDYGQFSRCVQAYHPDYIVHLAARTDLNGKSLEDYSANTVGVENLMKIVDALPALKKVVVTSSMLVCHTGYCPKDQFDYSPTTFYGKSKVVTEQQVWAHEPHCDWAIIRPTSMWGPWFKEPYRNFFDMVLKHCYFHIGHKGCTKTYGYIGNAVYQIEQVMTHETGDRDNKVFYIGDSPATNIEEWANEIGNEAGIRIPRMPMWLLRCAAYTGDLLKKLGIHFPMTSFRLKNMTTDNVMDLSNTYEIAPNPPYGRMEGIRKTLEWMKSNEH